MRWEHRLRTSCSRALQLSSSAGHGHGHATVCAWCVEKPFFITAWLGSEVGGHPSQAVMKRVQEVASLGSMIPNLIRQPLGASRSAVRPSNRPPCAAVQSSHSLRRSFRAGLPQLLEKNDALARASVAHEQRSERRLCDTTHPRLRPQLLAGEFAASASHQW